MYRTILIPLLVALFVLNGCDKKGSSEQPTNEMAELKSQLLSSKQRLTAVGIERNQLQNDLRLTRDSLEQALATNDTLVQRVQDTEAQLALARSEFRKAFAALDATLTECRTAKGKFAVDQLRLNADNRKLQSKVNLQAGEILQLNNTLGATQQWHGYYKTVSKRSIFKHLFGAGKPPLPGIPDPSG
ncbi:hypothetical protein IID19_05390 [Patescibacteria group bacterium]|nr:hypothetical protein [Patescibacteria group bacterium]